MSVSYYKQLLKEHLGFIKSSADSFDAGNTYEALRIASSLRVIFHQTHHSKALLEHLDAWDISLRSEKTGDLRDLPCPEKIICTDRICFSADGIWQWKYFSTNNQEYYPVKEWWNEYPVSILRGKFITRKMVATDWLANKAGGSHVDDFTNLPKEYLQSMNSLFVGEDNRTVSKDPRHGRPVNEPFTCARQMACEVLTSPDLNELTK